MKLQASQTVRHLNARRGLFPHPRRYLQKQDPMEEALIFGLILCGIVSAIGYKLRYYPILAVSSMGLAILGLMIYKEQQNLLNLGLIIFIAGIQLFLPDKRRVI